MKIGQLFRFDPLPPNTFCLTTGGEPLELPDPDEPADPLPVEPPPEAAGAGFDDPRDEPEPGELLDPPAPESGICTCTAAGGCG